MMSRECPKDLSHASCRGPRRDFTHVHREQRREFLPQRRRLFLARAVAVALQRAEFLGPLDKQQPLDDRIRVVAATKATL
jgi:hypothetical protein